MAHRAHDAQRLPIAHPIEVREDGRAEIVLEWLDVLGVAREDDAVALRDLELLKTVLHRVEALRHPALPMDPSVKRDTDQLAFQVEGPVVIRAGKRFRVAGELLTELGTAMRAAVHEHAYLILAVADDHHWSLTHIGLQEVAGLRDLRRQSHVVP